LTVHIIAARSLGLYFMLDSFVNYYTNICSIVHVNIDKVYPNIENREIKKLIS